MNLTATQQDPRLARWRFLAILGSAIAGRPVRIAASDPSLAYTDGEIVYLPSTQPDADQLAGLIVQALLLAAGSFQQSIMRQLIGRASIGRRYLVLETRRALDLAAHRLPRSLATDLAVIAAVPAPRNSEEALERAFGREVLPEPHDRFGRIRPRIALNGAFSAPGGSKISEEDLRILEKNMKYGLETKPDDENEELDKSWLFKNMSAPFTGENALSKLMRDVFGLSESLEPDDGGSGGEFTAGGAKKTRALSGAARVIAKVLRADGDDPPGFDQAVYPEWQHRRGRYRPAWCRVSEFDPPDRAGLLSPDIDDRPLQRKLARLGLIYQRHGRQLDGDNLDVGALVDYAIDLAQGTPGDERVFEARRKTGRDLGVVVLLDASGSTADRQAGGDPIWEAQRRLAHNLVTALEAVGDSIAAYGFRSFGRNDVRFLRVKEFDHRFDIAAKRRLAALDAKGFTRLGAAIRHATELVSTRCGTGHRLMVVISDGLPFDNDYEDEHAEHDVRRALHEAIKRGVGCVCLSVGSSRDEDKIERLWGDVGHASLVSPTDLSQHIDFLFRSALKRARADA